MMTDAVQRSEKLAELTAQMRSAMAHHQAGRLEDAAKLYRKVLDAAPAYPQALRFLGVIELGKPPASRAVELLARALPAFAAAPEAHLEFGEALRLDGRLEEAAGSFRRAIELRRFQPMAHARLGGVLNRLGRFEEAIEACRNALALQPDFVAARVLLADAYKGAGRMKEASETWRAAIELDPDRAASYVHLGVNLTELRLLDEALLCFDRAVSLEPANVEFICARADLLIRMQNAEAAATAFREALNFSPESRPALFGLSWALRMVGRFEEAEACINELRDGATNDVLADQHLSSTGKKAAEGDEAKIERLARILEDEALSVMDRAAGGFALGRLLDSAERYDEAFARYADANALVRNNWPAYGDGFHAARFANFVDRQIEFGAEEDLAERAAFGNPSETPVFVFGMPRSGTTLVEQICASHSRVFGAGELVFAIPHIVPKLGLPGDRRTEDAETWRRAADDHLLRLAGLGKGAVRVVDKLPDNILFVGLIARLFPRARFVYCSRDPRDISLSCYFQRFGDGAQFFSYDLEDCGRRCRDVRRLGVHWLQLLPHHMIEVNYERLVGDLEGESRRLIEFLGLDWEPRCLDFHRTERTVTTVSHWQVRQPLYGNSVGRWRHYDEHLAPLYAALGEGAA
jgi:tetratricopeptide (TPR) repeat protein